MIFSRINEEATIKRSIHMLEQYPSFHRIEMREMILLKSPSLSGMPKGSSSGNNADENIIKKIDAHAYCEICRHTIEALENEDFRTILNMTFIKPVYNNLLIADKLGVSSPTYYHMRNDALLAYAEVCPGMPDFDFNNGGKMIDLIVWKNEFS